MTKKLQLTDASKEHTRGWIEGKDPRMEVLSEDPLVLQTPLSLLAGQRITDKKFLFVRNIQDLEQALTLAPRFLDGWEIELGGLIHPRRLTIRGEDLLGMPQVEYEMVLQCSVLSRRQFTIQVVVELLFVFPAVHSLL